MDVDDSKAEKPQLNPLRLSSASGDTHFDIDNETLIGREVECSITLPSPHVSRYHAKISVSDEGLMLEDLNSANGTFVNGRRISEKTKISLGDELRFDDLAYRITSKDSGNSDATMLMSNKAVLEAVQRKQSETASPPAPPKVSVVPEQAEEDGTRILSQDQLQQAASIHRQAQSFTDSGSGPRFVATTAPIRGQIFHLAEPGPNNSWRLGRSSDCEICVSAPSVSRTHSVITKENGRFHIQAENEAKPFVFNKLPQTSAMLKHNDHLQIGSIELVFRLDEGSHVNQLDESTKQDNRPLKIGIMVLITCAIMITAALSVSQLLPSDDALPKMSLPKVEKPTEDLKNSTNTNNKPSAIEQPSEKEVKPN